MGSAALAPDLETADIEVATSGAILVVDDDEEDALLVADLLEEIGEPGWSMVWRSTFDEALAELESGRYMACLVDFRLGRSTGIEFIERARSAARHIPMLLLTGENRRDVDLAAMRAGAVDFLPKDRLDASTLERAVRYAVERLRAQAELLRLARRDPLTGLHNRPSLEEHVDRALAHAGRSGRHVALCMIDLDGFKQVNDAFGHARGDELLQVVGRRLLGLVRPYDTVGRVGGDEFLVLLDDLESEAEAEAIGARVCAALQPPYDFEGLGAGVSASVGLSVSPRDGRSQVELTRAADAAMYEAKRSGKARLVIGGLDAAASVLPQTVEEVRAALAQDHFRLVLQPIVDVVSGAVVSFEALARWSGRVHSIAEVVGELERSGGIVELDLWMLERAVGALEQLPLDCRVSVNLSCRTLESPGVLDRIAASLPARPGRLELELTESWEVLDVPRLADQLGILRALGVRIALDDFGVGHSTFERVRQLPVDTIKLDRSFTADLEGPSRCEAIVESVLSLGERAQLDVVVEGVETEAQAGALRRLGAVLVQGFLYSRPLELREVAAWATRRVA